MDSRCREIYGLDVCYADSRDEVKVYPSVENLLHMIDKCCLEAGINPLHDQQG